jgi:hypothetical protein
MITMNRYSVAYAKSLVAATPVDPPAEGQVRRQRGLFEEQIGAMQRGPENVDRELKLIEKDYDQITSISYWPWGTSPVCLATRTSFAISRSITPTFWLNSRRSLIFKRRLK